MRNNLYGSTTFARSACNIIWKKRNIYLTGSSIFCKKVISYTGRRSCTKYQKGLFLSIFSCGVRNKDKLNVNWVNIIVRCFLLAKVIFSLKKIVADPWELRFCILRLCKNNFKSSNVKKMVIIKFISGILPTFHCTLSSVIWWNHIFPIPFTLFWISAKYSQFLCKETPVWNIFASVILQSVFSLFAICYWTHFQRVKGICLWICFLNNIRQTVQCADK